MSLVYFISHPEVVIDKDIPVPQWDLSEKGLYRLEKLLTQPWINSIKTVFSSNEQKAKTAAIKIAQKIGQEVRYKETLGEMDRSSTGVLPSEEFNIVVDEFFENPTESILGWEKAIDAQNRIVKAVEEVVSESPEGNIAIISHGGVGALLLSYLKKAPISRSEDQPGQGYYFVFDRERSQLKHSWKAIDLLD